MLTGISYTAKVIIGLTLAVFLLAAIIFGIRWVTADIRGAGDAREKTLADGAYRIAAYDKFYDDCAAVMALEAKILDAEDRPVDADAYPESVKNANVTALKNQRTELIAAYNADARKTDTKANFKASDLPFKLDPDEETTCEA